VETRRDDRFDQRIKERDERAGERCNEGTVVPVRTLARELVARVETLDDRQSKNNSVDIMSRADHETTHLSDDVAQELLCRILEQRVLDALLK